MSMTIAAHCGRFIMIATDIRATWFENGVKAGSRDYLTKLFESKAGLVCGTGLMPLVDAVQQRFAAECPTDTNHMLSIIEGERAAIADDASLPKWDRERGLRTTGWKMTFMNSRGDLRLVLFHPSFNGRLHMVPAGAASVSIPLPQPDEEAAHEVLEHVYLPANLHERIRVCGDGDDLGVSLTYHAALLRSVIDGSAMALSSISPACQIGIHVNGTRDVLVSGILQPGADVCTIDRAHYSALHCNA
jgi:hypothetical protein